MMSEPTLTYEFLTELGGPRTIRRRSRTVPVVSEASGADLTAFRALRRFHFVERQGLFPGSDLDPVDDDQDTIVLVAHALDGEVVGGVRIHAIDKPLGWWVGSRLVTAPGSAPGVGAALVRAACARAETEGALRFDATVQSDKARFFSRLGWRTHGHCELNAMAHTLMSWPIDLFEKVAAHKRSIGTVLGGAPTPGGESWAGDDGVPVPGTDSVVVNDSILGVMVERDPWWAGWCSVLVNANDVAAMGATAVGLVDGLTAPSVSLASEVYAGIVDGAAAWGIDVLGGHTQIGGHASLSVTMIGRRGAAGLVAGGGARPGQRLSLVADLGGGWRPGYHGRQWDSTSHRSSDELRAMHRLVEQLAPGAAKDVSMAGLVGTVGMMAEASGVGAELRVDRIPCPPDARLADWLTCFPGFAMVLAHDDPIPADHPALTNLPVTVAPLGRIDDGSGVRLAWPDRRIDTAIAGPVTGIGPTTPTKEST